VTVRALRLAYILIWFPERTQTFILDEANTLSRQGLDLQVYTLYGPRSPRRLAGMAPVAVPVTHLGIASLRRVIKELFHLRRNFGPGAWRFLARVLLRRWRSLETGAEAIWATLAGVHLARLFLAAGIDHIHAPFADGPATAAWVASYLSGIPSSFCAHAHDIYPPDGALEEKLRATTMVRVISEVNGRYLAALAPEEAHKLVRIYLGVPLTAIPAAPRPLHPPYRLLAMGRMVDTKGFPVLLAACRHLASWGMDFRLTLAGAGLQRWRLAYLVRKYGLQDRVMFPGFVPHRQVPEFFRQADLFIMSSRIDAVGNRDGIPTVILESLAHGVPVVATDVSGISEVIRPGETGWLAPPDDPLALAQAVREALADPAEARRRAQAGRELVGREFDSQKNYGRLKECFKQLI